MPIRVRHVIVEVSPSRVEVAVVRGGRVLRARSVRIDPGADGPQWPAWLDDLEPVLAGLVTELGCAGARATVVYHDQAAVAAVTSCPATLGAAEAEEACMLALAGIAGFPLDGHPVDNRALATDPGAPHRVRGSRQTHYLSAAERNDVLEAIAVWLERAGLQFDGATPAGGLALLGAATAALVAGAGPGQRGAALWIGEHSSALACVTEGRIRFVRPVAVGLESLVDALCQPIRSSTPGRADLLLDRTAARRLLAVAGVPAPETALHEHEGFTGASLLPVMQPALQRIAIETKQSLRFGLEEAERAGLTLVVAGPAASVPGLGDWLARQCGLALHARGEVAGVPPVDASSATGAIAALVGSWDAAPRLVSAPVEARRRRMHARLALLAGVALASAWIGGEWYTAIRALDGVEAQIAGMESRASVGARVARMRDAALAARLALAGMRNRAIELLGEAGDAAGVLEALALAAPEPLRLRTIEVSNEGRACTCRVSGFVAMNGPADPSATITGFVDALARTPIVSSARLGPTQRTSIEGAPAQAFDLILEIVTLPIDRDAGVHAAVHSYPTEGQP